MTANPNVRIGLERCLDDPPAALVGARFGLLMNQASVDRHFRYACDVLAARFPGQLAAIFSPQHGLWGEQQANMIESLDARYKPCAHSTECVPPNGEPLNQLRARNQSLDVLIHSLYSTTRRPSPEMLRGLNCFVVDLQEVGTRVYTFIWTVTHCLEACAAAGIPVIVLDRPNPLGGEVVEGPTLEPGFESFVGLAQIPMRHAQTLGELARFVNEHLHIGAQLEVVEVEGWRRDMLFPDTGRAWVLPSPNMPRFESALLYPGQVLLEGTNLSEGRGTTTPFELVGAPFIDPHRLTRDLAESSPPGVMLRPIRFVPTFDKWCGQSCGGVAIHVTNPRAVRSFALTVSILETVQRLYPAEFSWLPPPYEYEYEKMPIDILYGSAKLRERLDGARND